MHPILFEIPVFPAWIAAAVAVLLGAAFAWFARKDPKDRGSWWLAGVCGVAAAWILLAQGFAGTFGPLPIRWFGILVVSGFLLAAKVASMRNDRLGLLTGEESFDLLFYVFLAGLIGARIFHVLQNADQYEGKPAEMVKIWDGGLVWYGGALAGTLFAWYWLAKRKKDLWGVSDSIALAAPVGHAVGRIGCFLAGCDYGSIVEGGRKAVAWAVHFPFLVNDRNPLPHGTTDIPLTDTDPNTLIPRDFSYSYDPEGDHYSATYIHPAQLYEAGALVLVFAILFVVDRRTKGRFRGRLSALYCILYAVERAVVEHWRGDADRGVYFGGTVSFSQILSALLLVFGVLLYQGRRNSARKQGGAAA